MAWVAASVLLVLMLAALWRYTGGKLDREVLKNDMWERQKRLSDRMRNAPVDPPPDRPDIDEWLQRISRD